jgi:hypothetical protein
MGLVRRLLRTGPDGSVDWRAYGPPLLALALTTTVCVLGWRGVDQAAQAYRVNEVRLHGIVLWDTGWYGGNFPLSYSVLFPLVGAVVGLPVASVASAVVAAWAFDRILTTSLGVRTLGSWYFAASTILQVAIGQLPFLAGEALGLGAVLALLRGRRRTAAVLAVLTVGCSPLAGAFLALACAAWAGVAFARARQQRAVAPDRWRAGRRAVKWWRSGWWPPALVAGSAVAVIGLIGLVFPGNGPFPFPWTGLVLTELLCGLMLTPVVPTNATVRTAVILYAVASFGSFVFANPLGGNAPRLATAIGLPVVLALLTAPLIRSRPGSDAWRRLGSGIRRSWRVASIALVVPFAVWQWSPWSSVVTSAAADPSTGPAFYQPLLQKLAAVAQGPIRVEIPPTKEHWEAAEVAPHVALARGWERQLDVGNNPIFYTPKALTAASYQQWLTTNGVSWVALPNAPLDYAARQEAQLLRSGTLADLQLTWSTPQWQLWRVVDSPGLVSGPGRLTELGPDRLVVTVTHPGDLTVRVRYTSYWAIDAGNACIRAGPHEWMTVQARAAGAIQLSASVLNRGAPACSVQPTR